MAGSIARLDASPQADGDLIVVLDDDTPLEGGDARRAVEATWQRLAPLGLSRPRSDGVFARPTSRQQLCDGPRGVVAEPVEVFGKRIHFLLEARDVLGSEAFSNLQREILDRYAGHPFQHRPGDRWSYLTDDLIRYWRSYRVWRNWDTRSGSWYLRNVKLRHSRLVTYASLLFACVLESEEDQGSDSLLEWIRLPPLERLYRVDQQLKVGVYDEIVDCYSRYLEVIHDADRRLALKQASVWDVNHPLRDAPAEFLELLDNSDRLRVALVRLLRGMPDSTFDQLLRGLVF